MLELKTPGIVVIGILVAGAVALIALGHATEGQVLFSFLGGLLIPSPLASRTKAEP